MPMIAFCWLVFAGLTALVLVWLTKKALDWLAGPLPRHWRDAELDDDRGDWL